MPSRQHAQAVPTLLTLGNLLCGFTAILLATEGDPGGLAPSAGLILLAALLDGFDGYAARRLGVASEFGARLDGLADVVSFGAAPAVIVCRAAEPTGLLAWIAAGGLLSAVALRLARHGASGGSRGAFEGLPCPAAAATIACLLLAHQWPPQAAPPGASLGRWQLLAVGLPVLALGLSLLMVSRLSYPHPRQFERPGRWSLAALATLVVGAGWLLGGYAPLVICGLFIASPLPPAIAPQRRFLVSRRRDG